MDLVHRFALRAYRAYQDLRGPDADLPMAEQRRIKAGLWRPGPLRGTSIEPAEIGEWVVAPGPDSGSVVLWFHGGSYLFGGPAQRRGPASRLSRSSGASVLTAAYRLAPEHSFPAAVEDAVAAYRWLLAEGIAPEAVVIGGDSAGGGLAVAALVSLRDAGVPLPAGALLFSPWTDLTMSGASITGLAEADDVLDAASLEWAAGQYLAGADPRHPLASPVFADLAGLPPVFLQTGGAEILLDDSTMLAARIREAGGEAILDVWPGMPHIFQTLAPIVPEAGTALHQAGRFIGRVAGT